MGRRSLVYRISGAYREQFQVMQINPNMTGVTAPSLTRGIHGKNIAPVGEHLAETSSDTFSVLGGGLETQLARDLKSLQKAVDTQEARAGVPAAQKMGAHTAAMAAGALLGVNGMVAGMAGALFTTVRDPEKLESLAQRVLELPQQRTQEQPLAGDVFNSLSNRTLTSTIQHGITGEDVPVAMFLSGGHLVNEQQQGTLLDYQIADYRRPT